MFRRNQEVTRCAAAVVAVVAAIGMATLGTTAASAAGETAGPSLVKDPSSLVNPFIGTSNSVDEFPGAAAPFGMIDWSPDTSPRTISGGYDYNHIHGRPQPHPPVRGGLPHRGRSADPPDGRGHRVESGEHDRLVQPFG